MVGERVPVRVPGSARCEGDRNSDRTRVGTVAPCERRQIRTCDVDGRERGVSQPTRAGRDEPHAKVARLEPCRRPGERSSAATKVEERPTRWLAGERNRDGVARRVDGGDLEDEPFVRVRRQPVRRGYRDRDALYVVAELTDERARAAGGLERGPERENRSVEAANQSPDLERLGRATAGHEIRSGAVVAQDPESGGLAHRPREHGSKVPIRAGSGRRSEREQVRRDVENAVQSRVLVLDSQVGERPAQAQRGLRDACFPDRDVQGVICRRYTVRDPEDRMIDTDVLIRRKQSYRDRERVASYPLGRCARGHEGRHVRQGGCEPLTIRVRRENPEIQIGSLRHRDGTGMDDRRRVFSVDPDDEGLLVPRDAVARRDRRKEGFNIARQRIEAHKASWRVAAGCSDKQVRTRDGREGHAL